MLEWFRRQFTVNLAYWVAFWVWVAMIAGVTGRAISVGPEKGSVVPIYLGAGARWIAGEPLYARDLGTDLYRNPPGVAVLFAPLSLLPEKPVAIAWRLACVALYGFGIHRLIRDVLPSLSPWRQSGVWVMAAVFMLPAFNNGQINLLITATALFGVTAAAKGRWWEAAVWLAGCGWLKLYTYAVGLLVCVIFPKQLSWRMGVISLGLFVLPFVCQNPSYVLDRHKEFVEETRADDRSNAKPVRAPRDWTVIARGITGEPVPRLISISMSLVAAVAFAWVVWKGQRPQPLNVVAPLCLGLIWLTLFGPATEVNTYSVLAPVIGVFVCGLPNLDRLSKWLSWAGTAGLLVVEVRAAFSGEGEFDLSWGQPLGAASLTWAIIRWVGSEHKSGSGTGGI